MATARLKRHEKYPDSKNPGRGPSGGQNPGAYHELRRSFEDRAEGAHQRSQGRMEIAGRRLAPAAPSPTAAHPLPALCLQRRHRWPGGVRAAWALHQPAGRSAGEDAALPDARTSKQCVRRAD
eukprot:498569-Pyramimonas_sp.AAC.1